MSPSTLAILLGIGFAVPQIYALLRPEEYRRRARAFPRSNLAGYALVGIATVWFLYYVNLESVADFAHLKKYMLWGFGLLGIGTCLFVKDYVAVRGLAVVLLLLAKFTVDTTRWVESEWRLVLVCWAYVWVLAGIWLTLAPWRLRDLIDWSVASDERIRRGSGLRLGLALLVLGIGLFAL